MSVRIRWAAALGIVVVSVAMAQTPTIASSEDQISAAVLPLPAESRPTW